MFLVAAKSAFSSTNSSTDFSLSRRPLRENQLLSSNAADSVHFGTGTPKAAKPKVDGGFDYPTYQPEKLTYVKPGRKAKKVTLPAETVAALERDMKSQGVHGKYSPPSPRAMGREDDTSKK